ncbi:MULTISPECIES: phosphatase PAP2 family protein [Mycobacterium]|uniref:Membrane protein n=1 Tax=Mycobacterium kiyosense TaxID=2871094 RepID=A0A9P3V1H2_9MYCO|nr:MULTISPECIES: phosphatase PAP2 family protein [Mycobacterium]BDE11964.1 membrane protein [Mycobacterium sp. 20KCMC460]GLB84708.1 membrane protein [Mycobacterium kiyosense]GLB91818.1 membrane protein [Mycobacterium kiyosense]GLB97992.1 membrane protein [Mycobacterium kiyosense]GLC04224.1 membrane protein [Mycobacterium kiyosense]
MTRPSWRPAAWLAVAAVALYAVLWVGHRQNWGWLHDFDWMLLTPAHDIGVKHHGWVRFWYLVSIVLGPVPLRVLGLVAAAAALVRRQLRLALLVLLGAVLSGLVTWVAKGLAGRPRPATALVAAAETSFPSGHALEATAGVLALLTFLLPLLTARWLRTSAMTAGALSVFTVGVARVALNVHHPSDVVAGWALGYVFFMLCLWVLHPTPSRRRDAIGP